jgi:arylsulfatase A-like enzyme
MKLNRRAIVAAPFLRLSTRAQRPDRLNVLFLFADDMRADAIAAWGNRQIHTPNLDALARRGTSFVQAYNQGGHVGAVCIASRAMLLSGKSLWRATAPKGLSGTLMPQRFAEAGYRTYATGKWHNGAPALKQAFQSGGPILLGGMGPQTGLNMADFDALDRPTARQERATPLLADALIGFLERQSAAQPFFAYGAFTAPHDPRECTAEDRARYDHAALTLPRPWREGPTLDNGDLKVRDELVVPAPRTREQCRNELRDYYALITELDRNIGRVMKCLEDRNLLSNTIVAFAGDNGLAMGAHGLMGKQNMYEHSLRVPMILAAPRQRAATERRPVMLYGNYARLCRMAGLSVPAEVESDVGRPAYFGYRGFQRAIRLGNRKMIWSNTAAGLVREQYDLAGDPDEEQNRYGTKQQWNPSQFEDAAQAARELYADPGR